MLWLWIVCGLVLCSARTNLSVSDNKVYPGVCRSAASNEEAFAEFKRHPVYNLIHEYTTFEEGSAYLDCITRQDPDLLDKIERFRQNDRLGNPKTFDYEKIGALSPSTLRYIKMAGDLRRAFGDLTGMRVIEIGGGYGGQCKILSDLFAFESYTIVDLPDSLALARTYLDKLGVPNVRFRSPEELTAKESYDLVISDYGFSSCNGPVQKRLLERVFAQTKKGYLVCASYPKHFRVRPLAKEDLLKKLTALGFSHQVLPEEPLMGKNHFILKIDK
jgi:hypothetical protein